MNTTLVHYCWGALALVWLISAAFTKPTLKATDTKTRTLSLAVLLLGFYLVTFDSPHWLMEHPLPVTPPLQSLGVGLTVLGCAFAIWARLALGQNWSGRPTVKEDHELVVTGPYALARHPIYTGLLLAAAGTALADLQWRRILGVLLIVLAMAVKIRQEERLMIETFPQSYRAYQRRVKRLIPGLL
jgi:protein-S-isoprenylcysteine O-methyltransferase Ste14